MKEFADFIRNGHAFVIISHVSPDGDTMGCAAALVLALESMGKEVQWVCEGQIPADFMKFPEIARLTEKKNIGTVDSAIAVDCSDELRLGTCGELFRRAPNQAQIDHHLTNTYYGQVNVVRTRNACAFLVLEELQELGITFTDGIARALFIAIMTDTGRLSHSGITEEDVRQTAPLYGHSIRPDETIGILFSSRSLPRTKLNGRAIEHMQTAFDGKVTYTWLDTEDFSACGADSSDAEGVVELCRNVEGTQIAVFLRQLATGYKVSMRCLPAFDVAAVASLFGGGGHKQAAGCTLPAPREDALKTILDKLGELL